MPTLKRKAFAYITHGDPLNGERLLVFSHPNAPEAGMVGVAGGAPGLNAVMDGDLEGGYDVIVLANLDPPAAERVGRLIRQALTSP